MIARALAALVLAAALAIGPVDAAEPSYTNRLIHSADPYLLEHAHNPVDWYPWGPEAFAKAKAENKPIFLSIGYSTCYWCHVAEREIYSDPAIAAVMNKWFVNVKVDREERPDVDRLFIIATEMLTEHGAWPNNLFLTPDGKPFYAGSYFPPKDDGDTPGFPRVLTAIHDLWDNHRADKVEPTADEVMTGLRSVEAQGGAPAGAAVQPENWLAVAAQALLRSIDPANGGFGSPTGGPKFPQAPALSLLAADARLNRDAAARAALAGAIDAMALGGIRDQLAGGFGRYATEPTWSVPHFEKMLSDNAQLLAAYTDAFAATGSPLDGAVARNTAAYLLRDMALPEGGFATAQDAATDGVEGATYLWTRAQIEAVLGDGDTERFLGTYELVPLPEQAAERSGMGKTLGVLRVRLPLVDTLHRAGMSDAAALLEALAPLRAKLLAARAARPQPLRDDKIVIGLNGLAIAALARAGAALQDPALVAAATKAADRIVALAFDPATGDVKHQIFAGHAALDGHLGDYAMYGGALLTLAEVDGARKEEWHRRSVLLADAMLKRFLRPSGALAVGPGDDLLPISLEDGEDADLPSGTSAALDLLLRLGREPGGARFAVAGSRVTAHLAGRIAAHPTMWPSAVVALAAHPPELADPGAPKPKAAARIATAGPVALGVPSTTDHVHAVATVTSGTAGDTVKVRLTVESGYHINAHVPSLDYLVPTVLDFGATAPLSVDYPPAEQFKTGFSPTPLAVYQGTVDVVAILPKGAAKWTAKVTAQACTEHTCLPPSDITVSVERPGG